MKKDLIAANAKAQQGLAANGAKAAAVSLAEGVKLDEGKLRYDLLPPDALAEVTRIFTFGAEKYDARNWEKGMDWGRVFAAGQRHMMAFWGGEMYDPETGYLHTAHAAFAPLVLTAYSLRGIGTDTRGLPGTRPNLVYPFRCIE
jgi:hypothetical protein